MNTSTSFQSPHWDHVGTPDVADDRRPTSSLDGILVFWLCVLLGMLFVAPDILAAHVH
ncbi:MAG: hypothetical protein JSR18_06345 [Proteobacteria bacterium]|nr:hypothetical protein [Pseudomonadota bacterium]